MSNYADLEKLNELKNKGILSEEEYKAEKEKIMNGASAQNTQQSQMPPQIIINNTNTNTNLNNNVNGIGRKLCNKWVALILCFFFGFLGAHKFYEGKTGIGILYIFTGGLFFIGVVIDFIAILFKPNPYLV